MYPATAIGLPNSVTSSVSRTVAQMCSCTSSDWRPDTLYRVGGHPSPTYRGSIMNVGPSVEPHRSLRGLLAAPYTQHRLTCERAGRFVLPASASVAFVLKLEDSP